MLFNPKLKKKKKIYTNEIIWIGLILANFSLILIAFRFWGKTGLFVFAMLSIVLANIQAPEQITLFGLNASMGDISYIGIYLISDILSENYGKETARKLVYLGIFCIAVIALIMSVSLLFTPNEYDHSHEALNTIFSVFPRFLVASLCAFFISQNYDVIAYQFWRKKFPSYRHLWIRNSMSTLISQLLDNAIFNLIAFLGQFPLHYILEIFITSCLLRAIIAIADTPFMYFSVLIKNKVREI